MFRHQVDDDDSVSNDYINIRTLESQTTDEERFKDCEKLFLSCNHCDEENIEYSGVIRHLDDNSIEFGLNCTNCKNIISMSSVQVQLIIAINKFIHQYYTSYYVCDDTTCNYRSRMFPMSGNRCYKEYCRGSMNREYTDKMFNTQLLYLSAIFDPKKARVTSLYGNLTIQAESIINCYYTMLLSLKNVVDSCLELSRYRYVNISHFLPPIDK